MLFTVPLSLHVSWDSSSKTHQMIPSTHNTCSSINSIRIESHIVLFVPLKSVDSFSCPLRHVAQAQWIPHPRKPSLCHTSNWPVLDQLTEQPCRLSPQTCADKQSTSHILILDEASGQNSLWQGLVQSRLLTSNRIISCISRFQLLWYILHKIIYLGTLLECHHCSKKPTMMYTIRDMKGNCLLTKCYGVWIYHGQTSPPCVGHRIRDNKWTIILPGYLTFASLPQNASCPGPMR